MALDIKPEITLEEFNKIDLRVATVIHAETLPRAKKLLKLEIDMGERRTIVAGISETYSPEDLEGKQVVVVANLKPAKLMGILSNGMLLAAVEKDSSAVATLDKKVKPGTSLNECRSINEDSCSRSRHAKKMTRGICLIFRGLFFKHHPSEIGSAFHGASAEIGQKDHLWMDTN